MTTSAYTDFVAANDLAAAIGNATDLVEAFAAADIPDGTAAAIAEAYAGLGDQVPVAVRSSATAEDLAEASFAGQQDTFLNVVGADAVLAAVRDCWASLWNDRAVAYRAAHAVDTEGLAQAVVG